MKDTVERSGLVKIFCEYKALGNHRRDKGAKSDSLKARF